MILTRLREFIEQKNISPEKLALQSNGKFSNMSVRRAMEGKNVHNLIAKAIARELKANIEDLV